ncbi:class I lanthipeptide, partial [Chryseobacterium piperi]
MKTNKFSALQLNKKSIARLNDGQLTSVKGGNRGNQLE